MINPVKTYKIDGRKLSGDEILSLALEKVSVIDTPQWERDMWAFLLQWFGPGKTITVKTSGSTGEPGEILLKKSDMVKSAENTISFFKLNPGDITLLCLPVKYIAGKMMVIRALTGKLDLRYIRPVAEPDYPPELEIRFAAMTPMQVAGILKGEKGREKLEQIEKLIIGGAAVPPGLEKDLKDLQTDIWHTYGMTETITHIAFRSLNAEKGSRWFKPLAGVTVRIASNGCLVIDYPDIGVRGFETGDLAEVRDDGDFRILGRIDNMVNSGGIKLFPESLEQRIGDLKAPTWFLAGIDDETLGQRLVMLVEDDAGSKPDLAGIKQKVLSVLEGHERPKQFFLLPGFIRTENGKLRRKETLKQLDKKGAREF